MPKVQVTIHTIDKKAAFANVDVDAKGYAKVAMPSPVIPTHFELQYLDWDTANQEAAPHFTQDDVLRAAHVFTGFAMNQKMRKARVERVRVMLRELFPNATFEGE